MRNRGSGVRLPPGHVGGGPGGIFLGQSGALPFPAKVEGGKTGPMENSGGGDGVGLDPGGHSEEMPQIAEFIFGVFDWIGRIVRFCGIRGFGGIDT